MDRLILSLDERRAYFEPPRLVLDPKELHHSHEVMKFIKYKDEIDFGIRRMGLLPEEKDPVQENDMRTRLARNPEQEEKILGRIQLHRESEELYRKLLIKEAADLQYYSTIKSHEILKQRLFLMEHGRIRPRLGELILQENIALARWYQLLLIDETIIVLKDKNTHRISPLVKKQNEERIEELESLTELIERRERNDLPHPITTCEILFSSELFVGPPKDESEKTESQKKC